MAEVHVLPGIERRDLAIDMPSAETVLRAAIEAGLTEAVVVGRDRSGQFYIASSMADADRCVGYLFRAANHIASADVISEPINTDDAG